MRRIFIAPLILAAALGVYAGISGSPAAESTEIPMFRAAHDGAETAAVHIDVPFEKVWVRALKDSDSLIEANTQHIGEMIFTQEDGVVHLREKFDQPPTEKDEALRWDVWLNPQVPLDLALHINAGSATLDASALSLASLDISADKGQMTADLPVTALPIPVEARVYSGAITVNLPDEGAANFKTLEIGSGQITLKYGANTHSSLNAARIVSGTLVVSVPPEAAVRVEIQHVGAGMVNMEHALVRISGTDPDEGIWETNNFASAERQIYIVIERIDAGRFVLRRATIAQF
jgi:hypothetical protein